MGKPGKIVVCPVCGKEFRRTAKQKKFCSDACKGKKDSDFVLPSKGESAPSVDDGTNKTEQAGTAANSASSTQTLSRGSRDWRIRPRHCVICGKEFIPKKSVQKTCSDECQEEFKKREDNPDFSADEKIPAGAKCETCWRLRRFWNFQELCTVTMQPPSKPCSLWRGEVLDVSDEEEETPTSSEKD